MADINEQGRDRSLQMEEAAKKAGFSPAPPLFAVGTPVNKWGQDNFLRERQKWEDLPLVEEACAAIAEAIEDEQREDLELPLKDVSLIKNGGWLLDTPDEIFNVERRGLAGLFGRLNPGGCTLSTRNITFVEDMPACEQQLVDLVNKAIEESGDAGVTLRIRDGSERRQVFAAVSSTYGAVDHSTVWKDMALELEGQGARAEGLYDPSSTRASLAVTWVPELQPEEVVAGEFFRAGVRLGNRDDGTGSFSVKQQLWRNLCLNLIIIHKGEIKTSVKHVGDKVDLRVKEAVKAALDNMAPIVGAWTDARRSSIEDLVDQYAIDGVFERLVAYDIINKPTGIKRDDFVDALLTAWMEEPDYNRAGIANAVSRVAHEADWGNIWVTEDLERNAGKILLRTNLL